jgi:ADP-ribose pyrophosphatase YjhB (NUDIX family)
MDIKILNNELKFKLRVSAIYIYRNQLLVNKYEEESYCLPGGYIEIGEDSEKAVIRELKEETELDFEIIKFGGIIENFFTNKSNQKTHEIDFYYFVKLKADSIDKLNMNYVENDKNGKIEHHYSWLSLNNIKNYNILPPIIKSNLNLEQDIFHYIINE